MMKKLLVLALVLGLTSFANALTDIELSYWDPVLQEHVTDEPGNVTEITINICEYLVIDVHGPVAYDWLGYVIIEWATPGVGNPGGEWGDNLGPPYEDECSGYYYLNEMYPISHPGAGDMAGVVRYEEADWGFGYEVQAAMSEGGVPGGLEFELIYHCCGPISEYVTITLWDAAEGYDVPQDTIVIHQVPEPMTIALLGLGGLFLLRRRR